MGENPDPAAKRESIAGVVFLVSGRVSSDRGGVRGVHDAKRLIVSMYLDVFST